MSGRRDIGRYRAGGGGGGAPVEETPATYLGSQLLYWADPSDLTVQWQESTRATPAAVDSAVGSFLNKGVLGGYGEQAVSGKRLVLKQDGSGYYQHRGDSLDDFFSIALNLSAYTSITVLVGLEISASASTAVAMEFSANASSNNGAFYVATPNAANTIGVNLRGTTAARYDSTGYTAPQNRLLVATLDIGGTGIANEIFPYIDGTLSQVGPTGTDCGTGNFGNYTLYEFMRAGTSFPLSRGLYQRMLIADITPEQRAWVTTWAGARQGKTL